MTVHFPESAVQSTLPRLEDEQPHDQQAEGHRPSSSSQNTGALSGLERLPRELLLQTATDTPEIRSAFRLTSRNLNTIANAATRELRITDRQALPAVIQGRYPLLTSLTVSGNGIGDAEATALAGNRTLTSLNVSGNQINAAGAMALAGNRTLTSLGLRGNYVGDAGARALTGNTTLTSLDLRNNESISDAVKDQLRALALESGRTILV